MRQRANRSWQLTRIAIAVPGASAALLTDGPGLGIQFFSVWLTLKMIVCTKAFHDAPEQMDAAGAFHPIGVFAVLTALMC